MHFIALPYRVVYTPSFVLGPDSGPKIGRDSIILRCAFNVLNGAACKAGKAAARLQGTKNPMDILLRYYVCA